VARLTLAGQTGVPAHGYELKGSFEEAVGDQWGGLNIGHLYQILDRLARDGLIESERQPQSVKPDRVVHRITPAGRAELERWLSEPGPPLQGRLLPQGHGGGAGG
jgi:DNA-binding PadR family transcriptional regulator